MFTHRLSTPEIDGDRLRLDPDLSTLARLAAADGGLHRPDGAPLPLRTIRRPGEGRCGATFYQRQLACPKGWLASFAPGTLLVVRAEEGLVHIDALEETDIIDAGSIGPTLREPMLAAIEIANDGLRAPVFAEEVQVAALVEGWHRPTASAPPFGEVMVAAGYAIDGASVGEAGWWATQAWVGQALEVAARHAHHLDVDEAEPLTGFLQAFIEWRSDRSIDPDPQLAARLRRPPEAAIGLEEELVRLDPGGHDLLGFLDRLGPPDARAVAVVETPRALAADLTGDPVAAEAHVDAALASTPGWFPAIEARIHFLSARGRARETVNLLQHIRRPEDHQLAVMRDRFKASTTSVRRNDPCPCGSARKSKHCHQGRVEIPGDVRVTWLLDKARDHLHRFAPPHLGAT